MPYCQKSASIERLVNLYFPEQKPRGPDAHQLFQGAICWSLGWLGAAFLLFIGRYRISRSRHREMLGELGRQWALRNPPKSRLSFTRSPGNRPGWRAGSNPWGVGSSWNGSPPLHAARWDTGFLPGAANQAHRCWPGRRVGLEILQWHGGNRGRGIGPPIYHTGRINLPKGAMNLLKCQELPSQTLSRNSLNPSISALCVSFAWISCARLCTVVHKRQRASR